MLTYTRSELLGLISARAGSYEGQGDNAFLNVKIKITPEMLAEIMAGHFVNAAGKRARLMSVYHEGDGFWVPVIETDTDA